LLPLPNNIHAGNEAFFEHGCATQILTGALTKLALHSLNIQADKSCLAFI
jgi:hypothetical protein